MEIKVPGFYPSYLNIEEVNKINLLSTYIYKYFGYDINYLAAKRKK